VVLFALVTCSLPFDLLPPPADVEVERARRKWVLHIVHGEWSWPVVGGDGALAVESHVVDARMPGHAYAFGIDVDTQTCKRVPARFCHRWARTWACICPQHPHPCPMPTSSLSMHAGKQSRSITCAFAVNMGMHVGTSALPSPAMQARERQRVHWRHVHVIGVMVNMHVHVFDVTAHIHHYHQHKWPWMLGVCWGGL
jgi:hypothetical protein